jgi:hypothetical protein
MALNLIYTTVIGEPYVKYFLLLYKSLEENTPLGTPIDYDILVITNRETGVLFNRALFVRIRVLFFVIDIYDPSPYSARYLVYKWSYMFLYDRALYVDTDVIFHTHPLLLWSAFLHDDEIAMKRVGTVGGERPRYDFQFGGDYIDVEHDYHPINSGQFIFNINSKTKSVLDGIYNNIIANIHNITRAEVHDQIEFNLFVVANKIRVNYTILDTYCHLRQLFNPLIRNVVADRDAIFTHFAGYLPNKYKFIRRNSI